MLEKIKPAFYTKEIKMGRFQSCKSVVERALRRAFYDGVLELYEGHGSTDTVTAVTLEGTLTLTINRAETLVIRLNEVAQRAEEVTTELEDHVRDAHEGDQHGGSDRETESTSKKRKRDAETLEEEKKTVMKLKKEVKVETDCYDVKKQATPTQTTEKPREIARECDSAQVNNQTPEATREFQSDREMTETAKQVVVKKEPRGNLSDVMSYASPDHSDSHHGTVSEGTIVSKSEDLSPSSPKGPEESFPVTVKREPKVESIVIEDDDDDDDRIDSNQQNFSSPVPQLSPVHSLWYKRSHGSRQHHPSHRTSGRGHTQRKNFLSSYGMDSPDPQQMALLLERNDCPVCGEVLHNRQELSSHLHAHRHTLQSSCSVCRANTLTLDALLLHFSTMHSPHVLSMSPAASSDSLFSQALIPALPYAHGPMSAIASLVSMAACQAGPSSSALFGSGGGMTGGMSSLMEQIIAYRGLLPCPICQLLCSSKQHLAAHVTLMHGSSVSGGQGEERESALENNGDEAKLETRQDSDTEGSSSSSFFCFDCSIGFSSHALFAQHCMLQHNSTSVVNQGSCSVCHRAFDTWKTLHAHYLAAHGITNFCDRCKMGFTSTTELKTHYDSTHSAENRGLTFICDICNKGFYSQSQCSAHKRSHISEKSFACQVCGSAFFKRGDLSKHFRTVHAPNRVFACRFCGKRGTRMDNMRSHVKSHGKHMTRDEVLSFIEEVKS